MRYLKNLIKIMGFVGVIIMIWAVCRSDYMDEIGEYYSFADFFKTMLAGMALLTPSTIMLMCGDKNGK